jgi:glycosyltransferase involved in cell wall biosynthesis
MKDKLITIVIPVYKVEDYIRRCLDSLIVAPKWMEKMDVLIINDGTPDRSADISREYTIKYPETFRQIDKENGGHGSVLNIGCKEAIGKYIKFCDSDDWLDNVELMLKKLELTDADIIISHIIDHCPNNVVWEDKIIGVEFNKVYETNDFDWIGNKTNHIVGLGRSIYKTSMFTHHIPLFPEKQSYDDIILNVFPVVAANTLEAWDFPIYHYDMDRPGQSISQHSSTKKTGLTYKNLWKGCIEFAEANPINVADSTKIPYLRKRIGQYYNMGYAQPIEDWEYADAKLNVAKWAEWVENRMRTQGKNVLNVKFRWRALYNRLPFIMFYLIFKSYKLYTQCKPLVKMIHIKR